jgi:hypothetical protein
MAFIFQRACGTILWPSPAPDFLKVPALPALAPSVPPAEPPFAIVQDIVLAFFVVVIIGAIRRANAGIRIQGKRLVQP